MNKIIIYLILITAFLGIAITGCGRIDENSAIAPDIGFHGSGWNSPSSPNFHGNAIESVNWSMEGCKECHGADLKGGKSGSSCYTCHTSGPRACNLCHGNPSHIYPPKALNGNMLPTQIGVGVHDIHLSADSTIRNSAVVSCFECHPSFTSYSDTNHIRPDGQNIAKVVFGSLAKRSRWGVTPNPSWDRNTQKCSNVYCHGYFLNGNMSAQPVFIAPGSLNCGSCHGNPATGNPLPGGTHPAISNCSMCHGIVVDSTNRIINKYRHINGEVDFNVNN